MRFLVALALICCGVALALWLLQPRSPGTAAPRPNAVNHATRAKSALVRPKTAAVRPEFENVAASAGVDFNYFNDEVADRFYLPEIMGGGAAWFDFDGDGLQDLYLVNGQRLVGNDPEAAEHVGRMWRNRGHGRFDEMTLAAMVATRGYGHGISVGDFNVDGFPDLYLSNFGPDVLLQNNGDGTFQEVTAAAGMVDDLWGFGGVWFDADSDDDLDLYVINYLDWNFSNTRVCELDGIPIYCGPSEYVAQRNLLYLSRGDGTFEESAEQSGLDAPDGKSLAVAAADLDEDLLAEVYVANDMAANFLFTRTRSAEPSDPAAPSRPYQEVAALKGCAVDDRGFFEASMGIACGDYDRDGRPDLYLSHFYQRKNTLYQNLGELQFEDASRRTRIAQLTHEYLGFGTVAFDYDRDGWLDLLTTNGHVFGAKYPIREMKPQLLRNDRTGSFVDVSNQAGSYINSTSLGRGVAAADYDDDGDTDFLVTHLHRPAALLRNDTGTKGAFLGLELQTANRIPPVGGRVIVRTGAMELVTPVVAGGSYLCSNDPRLLIGLGEVSGPVEVEVHWPGSERRVESLTLEVNRYWLLVEGQPEPCPVP